MYVHSTHADYDDAQQISEKSQIHANSTRTVLFRFLSRERKVFPVCPCHACSIEGKKKKKKKFYWR